jgi:molybdopterin converting factor small subunit
MRVRVELSAQLAKAAGGAEHVVEVEVEEVGEAASLDTVLRRLCAERGERLERVLLDAGGRLRPGVLVFINDVQAATAATLKDGDVVALLAAIAGGSGARGA